MHGNRVEILAPMLIHVLIFLWLISHGQVTCSTSFAPEFYKPGNGVFMEQWFFTSHISIHDMNGPPFSDDCPQYAKNLDNFEFYQAYSKMQNIIARAYFVPNQTGNHRFFAICDDNCVLDITFPQYNVTRSLLTMESWVQDDWAYRKWATDQFLEKDVRYLLRMRYYGEGGKDFFRIGVKLPDNSELKPITKEYIWRPMEFYSWNGLLGRYYNTITFPTSTRSMKDFRIINSAVFPDAPSHHICVNTIYHGPVGIADNFAAMYIGYMRLPKNDNYQLQLYMDAFGEVNITKSETVDITGANDVQSGSRTSIDAGYFNVSMYYPMKIVHVEYVGNEFKQIKYRATNDSYSANWLGLLRNLINVDPVIPPPEATATGSFNISVTLSKPPYLPQDDNWTYENKYWMKVYKKQEGQSGTVQSFGFIGPFPKTSVAYGLQPNTDYCIFIEYSGLMNNTLQHNLYSSFKAVKTEESVPGSAPSGISVQVKSSTSVGVTWQHLVDEKILNGIRTGYEVLYAIKDASPKIWSSLIVSRNVKYQLLSSLEEHTTYEIKVAARTSKGSGVFSSIFKATTREDSPSAAPSNITAHNTSSSSISIQWKDVPFWNRNGDITKYTVYFKRVEAPTWQTRQVNEPSRRSLQIGQLDLWQKYEIRISAFTIVGEGPQSTPVIVRTDEDKPTASPSSVNATAISPTSISVAWNEIEVSKAFGEIIEYTVKYRRTDGQGVEKEIKSQYRAVVIHGLESHISYGVKVAGSTIKGYGPFSTVVEEVTLQGEPSSPPTDVKGRPINSTVLLISWNEIPIEHRNGIITKYIIEYRESKTSTKSPGKWENLMIDSSSFAINISGLHYYTMYDVKIAGINVAGIGNYSEIIAVRTDAYAPGSPPLNLTGHFANHTAITMFWFRVPKPLRFGTIDGYKLRYADKTVNKLSWTEITIPNRIGGGDLFNITIGNLKIYTPYLFDIAAYTYRAVGEYSDNVTVWTDEYVPSKPPSNITAKNGSSTNIVLHWQKMSEAHDDANGKVLGYIVKYRVIDCHKDRPVGCDEKAIFNITSFGNNGTIELSNLRKYTSYEISMQVFNSKGKGVFSKAINVTTGEDKPDAAPALTESWPSTYDSIRVYWSPLPESLRNGIILGYRIFYKPINIPLHKHERAPRNVDPLAIYGALPGEKMNEVNGTAFQTLLTDLKNYSWYSIRIGAFTSKGLGITAKINGTCKQAIPVIAPVLTVIDNCDLHEISLKWSAINETSANGEVLGYRISYWLTELNYEPVFYSEVLVTDVHAPRRSAAIVNLKPFAKYAIQIAAFTEAGFGVQSERYYGDTCRCPKKISSALIFMDSLVNDTISNGSVLLQIVDDAIVSCCGNCSRGQGISQIDWSKDANNASSLKFTVDSLVNASYDRTHVALPIFHTSDSTIETVYGYLTYVPVVPLAKMLVFRKKYSEKLFANAASSTVIDSLLMQYPLYTITILITVLAGILFWIFESGVNKEEFSDAYSRGCGSGFWLAYTTMTTVGYGDLTPVTRMGRIHATVWMLIGLVLTSLIIGNLSSLFVIKFVFNPVSNDMEENILVSDGAFMLAARFYGQKVRTGNISDGPYVLEQLEKGNVSKLFIDAFAASSIHSFIDSSEMTLDKIIDVKASYGILLSGDLKRISKCVKKYIEENKSKLVQDLLDSTIIFKTSAQSSNNLVQSITSSNSDLVESLIQYGSYSLGVLFLVGITFELVKIYRGRYKITPIQNETETTFNSIANAIEVLPNRIESTFQKKHTQHIQERMRLKYLQDESVEHLILKMYPELPIFDTTLRDRHEVRKKGAAQSGKYFDTALNIKEEDRKELND